MLQTPLPEQVIAAVPPFPKPSQALPEPFVFVPITNSEASKGRGSAKRIVRAHVTRVQHAKSSTLSFTQNLQNWTVKPHLHRTQPARNQSQSQIQTPRPASSRRTSDESKRRKGKKSTSPEDDEPTAAIDEAVVAVPKIPAAKRLGASRQDPFWSYPVEYEPYLPAIFAHCTSPKCGSLNAC